MAIFVACGLTVLIETAFLALCGYRDAFCVAVIVCANILTNLTLNLVLGVFGLGGWWLLPLELAVVAAEFAIYAKAFDPSWRLLGLTFAANALSFSVGVLLFGL